MFPRVREVLNAFETAGLLGITHYFNQPEMTVDPSTWSGYIKQSIEKKDHNISLMVELRILSEKFKINEYVSKKERSRTSTDSSIG